MGGHGVCWRHGSGVAVWLRIVVFGGINERDEEVMEKVVCEVR
jgi:hypothetical protein